MEKVRNFFPHIRWTNKEVILIYKLYPLSSRENLLTSLHGRTISQIQNKANALGIIRKKPTKRTIEETRKAKREGMARLRIKNPELAKEKQRIWHKENRDKNLKRMRNYYGKRFFWGRAMKLKGNNRANTKALSHLWKIQRGLCALTGNKLNRTAQIDHILPKAKGGKDNIENIRWVCREVNYAKRDMIDEEFIDICKSVIRWIGERIELVSSEIGTKKVV